jgi:hypothetical protein
MPADIRSYTSLQQQSGGTLSEFVQLFGKSLQSKRRIEEEVREVLEACRRAEALVVEQTGQPVEKLVALEIGAGQLPRQTSYFAMKNDCIAIDLDVIPSGWRSYLRLLRQNGIKRFVKTIGRKLLGVDRQWLRELQKQLGVASLPKATFMQMDATNLIFADGAIDFV